MPEIQRPHYCDRHISYRQPGCFQLLQQLPHLNYVASRNHPRHELVWNSTKASIDHQAQWDALILFDPPLIAPEGHPLRPRSQTTDKFLAILARKRPEYYDRLEDLAERYRAQIGEAWVAGADRDMAEAVTRKDPAGGFKLACPPEYEARIYLGYA